mmetsp:Transcript_47035/g.110819  ORF Transcript_47035/g.110819 Transcript_47035/m.110819 type:complete len:233 (-) Transcript_47035:1404-2102(-)
MKYLECPQITEFDVALQSGIDVGDYCVQGRLEIYSCKLASSEKRLASSLDRQLVQDLGTPEEGGWNQSISPASASPLGSMNEVHTRKLLINMILTLNNTFADYDFRDLKPEDFVREASLEMVMNSVNSKMSRVDEATNSDFCNRLWGALTSEMSLRECEIYSYVADLDDDALSIGKIWSVNYFFYNKKLKKLAFFACWVRSKSRSRSMEGADDGDQFEMDSDGDMDFDMDAQ